MISIYSPLPIVLQFCFKKLYYCAAAQACTPCFCRVLCFLARNYTIPVLYVTIHSKTEGLPTIWVRTILYTVYCIHCSLRYTTSTIPHHTAPYFRIVLHSLSNILVVVLLVVLEKVERRPHGLAAIFVERPRPVQGFCQRRQTGRQIKGPPQQHRA